MLTSYQLFYLFFLKILGFLHLDVATMFSVVEPLIIVYILTKLFKKKNLLGSLVLFFVF